MKKPSKLKPSSSKIQYEESDEEIKSSLDEEEDEEEDQEEEIERELADVTFEELQKARSDGSHSVYQKSNEAKKTGRANKNRPMETSSKKPVNRFREVVQVPKKVVRDPRFETLCGKLDVTGFRKRYDFLFENNLPAEREELKKRLKKINHPEEINNLKYRITWIDKQLKFESRKHTDVAILAEHKKKEREAVKHGKRPYYLKKSEIRKQRLIEKYNSLKASGKLESFIEKRRRKNASKDHRYMPYRRSGDSEQQN